LCLFSLRLRAPKAKATHFKLLLLALLSLYGQKEPNQLLREEENKGEPQGRGL